MVQTDAKKQHDMGAGDVFFSAADLNSLVAQRRRGELASAAAQAEQIKQLMGPVEVTTERLANFMRRVRSAAERGEHQILVLRFPSDMCSDRGRAINNVSPGWEDTLVGMPKQMVEVWREHLKHLGFGLSAEVLDYPHGMPGDIGLFCRW